MGLPSETKTKVSIAQLQEIGFVWFLCVHQLVQPNNEPSRSLLLVEPTSIRFISVEVCTVD